MKIIIRNQTSLPNKYIRFIKWKLYGLGRKFKNLHYAELFLKEEGRNPLLYLANIKLGVPGYDIIVKHKNENISELLQICSKSAHRYLAQRKNKVVKNTKT